MTRSLLADAFGHHIWATVRLIDACAGLTPEQLATTVPGTYGSILDTMRHLVGADAGYLSLLSGGRVAQIDELKEGTLSLSDMRAVIEADGAVWSSLLADDVDPDVIVVRHRDDGSEARAPLGVRLAQAVQHGTDHRSQVCTALTTLGVEPPEIDVWAFAWDDGRLVEIPPPA